MTSVQQGRRRLWLPAALLAVLSFAGAGFLLADDVSPSDPGPSASAASTQPSLAPTPASPKEAAAAAATALRAAGAPQRIYIESLGIDAPVLPIETDGRTLEPPPDPQELGWWSEGARPGAAHGSALITGHTVHDGGGALDDLETVRPGARIGVRTANGLIHYVATSVDVLDKATIARRAQELFSQEVDGRLVLVTCEDWDGTGYLSNVVVTASPAN